MSEYQLPPIELLNKTEILTMDNDIEKYTAIIDKVLSDYRVKGKVVDSTCGPLSMQFEIQPDPGVRINKILNLKKEFGFYLGTQKVELLTNRLGKTTIGLKIPNPNKYDVSFRSVLAPNINQLKEKKIPFIIGKKDNGEDLYSDIVKLPHLLVGGYTGSGKSSFINEIISTIIMTKKPDEVKLAIIDQKSVDLTIYNGLPHLIYPVITDARRAIIALEKLNQEMIDRYSTLCSAGAKSIAKYNNYVDKYNSLNKDNQIEIMSYLVVVIDWIDDIMLQYKKEIQDTLYRLLERGDEVGIHFIVSAQRPSSEVLPEIIKDRLESKVSFAVRNEQESIIILGKKSATELSRAGELIYKELNKKEVMAKAAFITDDEIKKLIDWTVSQQKAQYSESFMNLENPSGDGGGSAASGGATPAGDDDDPLYNDIVEFVVTTGKASASLIQRKFKLGYNRAARIVDLLEERGIIGPPNGSKPREVLVNLTTEERNDSSILIEDAEEELEEDEEEKEELSDLEVLKRFTKDKIAEIKERKRLKKQKRKTKEEKKIVEPIVTEIYEKKYCGNCGKKIEHDTKYCINCGAKL